MEIIDLSIFTGSGQALVSNINLSVHANGTLTIIGETGSGKSLVAQAVMGLLPNDFVVSGSIRLGGSAPIPASDREKLRSFWAQYVMLLPQEPRLALNPTMQIGRQIAEAEQYPGQAHEMTRAVGLSDSVAWAYPHMLSGGMAQRVLIATGLTSAAPLLIADEPTKGLDDDRVNQATELLATCAAHGRTLFVITHDIRVAKALDGDIVVMRDGRVIEQGKSSQILDRPSQSYTQEWLDADPARWTKSKRPKERSDTVVELSNVSFRFPKQTGLIDNVSLRIQRGRILALCGQSGCGKTTLGNIALGLLKPVNGQVRWLGGTDPYRRDRIARRLRPRFQKLHQDPNASFAPHRTIHRQFHDLHSVLPLGALNEKLPAILDRLDISTNLLKRYPAEISGGEAQRLAIARILLFEPDFVLADEPTSRLDPIVQRRTIELIAELGMQQQMAVMLITHDKALANAVADDTIHLRSNRA